MDHSDSRNPYSAADTSPRAEEVHPAETKAVTETEKPNQKTNSRGFFKRLLTRFLAKASERFAVEWWGFIVILIVLALIGLRIQIHNAQQAHGGLLGRPLRVGIVPWPGYAGGLVANQGLKPKKDSIFWRDHNLFVEFVVINNDDQMRRAFIEGGDKGGIDVMWSTVDSLAQQYPELLKEGVRPRGFMQVDRSYGGDAIITKNGIEKIEDFKNLKEKKIAVSVAASQWLLEYNLFSATLTNDERARIIQSVFRHTEGSEEARDLFINNDVDVAVLWEPDVTTALQMRKNAHTLIDTRAEPNLIADVMVAREEFIRDHRNVIKAFINGWLAGTTKAINDPMLAVKVLMDWPELRFDRLGEEKTRELLGKTVLTTLEDNADMFGLSDGDIFFDSLFNRATEIYLKAGHLGHAAIAAEARDATLLQEIYDLDKEATARSSCDGNLFTTPLAVSFLPDKADLSEEAMHNLDDPDIGLSLRINFKFRVCVEAETNELDNPQLARATKQAREVAVIRYLVEKHNRPPDQFVSYIAGSSSTGGGKVSQYMRFKLVAVKPQSSNARTVQ